jgi:hypothetical protein
MPVDVFISHSSDDSQQASFVCAHREAAGITCWIAPRDIPPKIFRLKPEATGRSRFAPRASDV